MIELLGILPSPNLKPPDNLGFLLLGRFPPPPAEDAKQLARAFSSWLGASAPAEGTQDRGPAERLFSVRDGAVTLIAATRPDAVRATYGHWTGGLDRPQLDRVLSGQDPFDETTMIDDHGDDAHLDQAEVAPAGPAGPVRPTQSV